MTDDINTYPPHGRTEQVTLGHGIWVILSEGNPLATRSGPRIDIYGPRTWNDHRKFLMNGYFGEILNWIFIIQEDAPNEDRSSDA